MNPSTPLADADLPRVQELLPWFAMGALTDDDQTFVEQWLARHGTDHPELQAELAWLRGTATLARENAREHAAEAGLGDLMARIAVERPLSASVPHGPQGSTRWARFAAWVLDSLAPRSPARAFAVAAVVLAQTVVISTLLMRETGEQAPLSGASVGATVGTSVGALQGMALFTVAWRADAREADIRALLASAQAQIVAGPSALGLYRVMVPVALAPAGLAALQAASHLVESVQAEP